ncbi:MAG: PHP domain-containing protein [Clostridiales bacterium]|jgi:PHP family Zn ribbon phosphoesterase|nr:PHP domain-containing protein [Clostridiales bacterium]
MRLYYDLHMHSALSPCGDADMTPNNIVNMSLLNGLDIIALTDHNSCKNAAAFLKAAENTELLALPGMELETSEEIHVVCLLPDLAAAAAFDEYVEARLMKIPNKPGIFGNQSLMDENDEITGEYPHLLITQTSIGLSELPALLRSFGGVCVPAHIDRSSNSVVSNLGMVPPDFDAPFIELSKRAGDFTLRNARLLPRKYGVISSSDAHYLQDINERVNYLEFQQKPTAKEVIERLWTSV